MSIDTRALLALIPEFTPGWWCTLVRRGHRIKWYATPEIWWMCTRCCLTGFEEDGDLADLTGPRNWSQASWSSTPH